MLRGEGLDVHGQIAHPDPDTAVMHVVEDERVDEIVISTLPANARDGCGATWSSGVREDTGRSVEHIETPAEELEGAGV